MLTGIDDSDKIMKLLKTNDDFYLAENEKIEKSKYRSCTPTPTNS